MSELNTIKELRKSVNMTQSQFAEWLSTSIENVKNWERGKSQPSEMLLKLINYYVEGHMQGKQINLENELILETMYCESPYTERYQIPLKFIKEVPKNKEETGFKKYYKCQEIEI